MSTRTLVAVLLPGTADGYMRIAIEDLDASRHATVSEAAIARGLAGYLAERRARLERRAIAPAAPAVPPAPAAPVVLDFEDRSDALKAELDAAAAAALSAPAPQLEQVPPADPVTPPPALETLSYKALQALAKGLGLKHVGVSQAALIESLSAAAAAPRAA